VFGLVNLIIERLGQESIAPHVAGILPLLPRIWQAAADQSLLRIQVRSISFYLFTFINIYLFTFIQFYVFHSFWLRSSCCVLVLPVACL
jgi:hypothetical protein